MHPKSKMLPAAVALLVVAAGSVAAQQSGERPSWAERPPRALDLERHNSEEIDSDRSEYREDGPLQPESYDESRARLEQRRGAEAAALLEGRERLRAALARATEAAGDGAPGRARTSSSSSATAWG